MTPLRPLILSTYDRVGGAATAAYRLHQGLQQIGLESRMLVGYKFGQDPSVVKASPDPWGRTLDFFRPALDSLPLTPYPRRSTKTVFSFEWLPDRLADKIASWQPSVINLHWIGSGFVQIESLARWQAPVCLTFHDMWFMTGGCHYSEGCDRFEQSCGSCPLLQSNNPQDPTYHVWQRKKKAWGGGNISLVMASQWMADLAKRSSLFANTPMTVIPYGLNTDVYRPIDRQQARQILNLPLDRQLILFGAVSATTDPRKGFDLLMAALANLPVERRKMVDLVLLGANRPKVEPNFGLTAHYLGSVREGEDLARVYAAADVFVLPSREDNLPNMLLETLACGTPCVSFGIGGIPEAIDNHQNGYIANPFDPMDLARGIEWVLAGNGAEVGANARQKALREYALSVQAGRYQSFYESLLGK
jgi:glycosyltransferase involved in cell wall biosynthesis